MDSTDIIVLKFADAKIPVFKETRNRDYIKYGEENNYPEYLTYLFNKSAKHNAIITGKADYIFGKGFENGDFTINRLGESLNDISKKAILDIEVYGGFRLEIIWNRSGMVAELYHIDYNTLRVSKDSGFWYKESWTEGREEEKFIPAFNPTEPTGSQIYAYNEYRPSTKYYPLPSYIGCNNYIETDIEISKFYLSSIRNGMMPSKMLQFFSADPGEEKKREIEAGFKRKFAGSENAGKFVMVFNPNGKDKAIEVSDLSGSELDKMFVELNKTCQQEIFSGHKITSPMLFGIKTEGQLGGNTELQTAYSIFKNTYSKSKAQAFSKEIEYLFSYSIYPGKYDLLETEPVNIQLSDALIEKSITPDEVRGLLGLPIGEKQISSSGERLLKAMNSLSPLVANKVLESLTKNQILEMVGIAPTPEGNVVPNTDAPGQTLDSAVPANDNVKNLTGKQHQQLLRIIRQYGKGQLTEQAAKALLRTGLGLNDEDINSILGIEAAMSSDDNEDEIISVFDEYGDSKKDYDIVKSKSVQFDSDFSDEEIFIKEAFESYDVTSSENEIIELIKKDNKITPKVIAEILGETEGYVKQKINTLVKRGYIDQSIISVGVDGLIERTISKDITAPPIKPGSVSPTRISIKYSYEGPKDSKNRPFCAKMLELNRLYSRADIEKISERLGYSVFDRRGGFWRHKNGTVTPYCRHKWKSNIVVKK